MPLKFTPKILHLANLYFFIQNMAEWHFSNRKEHNRTWRAELNFSVEAENRIQEFRQIHQQFPFGDKYLGRPFFLNDNPWSAIETLTGKNDAIRIKNIFTALEPYFNTLYAKDEVLLKKWVEIIEKPEFTQNASYINDTLACFYGCPKYDGNCTIYLLLSTERKNGGTAGTIDNRSVTIELSQIPEKSEGLVRNILWHELIHLHFRNHKLYPLLYELTNNDREVIGKIDELVASALLPNGLLSKNILIPLSEFKTSKNYNARIATEKIANIQKLIYPYLKQKKTLGTKLTRALLEEVK